MYDIMAHIKVALRAALATERGHKREQANQL